jgi:hypothetical protein
MNKNLVSLSSIWENSRGFEGGASKEEIFLHAAAQAGYQNREADAFLAALKPVARQDAFKNDIRVAVEDTIAKARSEGTVGISADCLWQCLASQASRSMHRPSGTNALYYVRQVFTDVISEKAFSNFVYQD